MLGEFPPHYSAFEKISGAHSPTRSQSLASNTTILSHGGSAQDGIDTTDGSENESWGLRATVQGVPESSPCAAPLLTSPRRRTMPPKCNHLDNEPFVADASPRRKGLHRNPYAGSPGLAASFAVSPQDSPQRLPPHITAVLDAAVANLCKAEAQEASELLAAPPGLDVPYTVDAPPGLRPPPGLEAPPGLEDFAQQPCARCETPPHPADRYGFPASIVPSPYRASDDGTPYESPMKQRASPFLCPPGLGSPWSPQAPTACWDAMPMRLHDVTRQTPAGSSPAFFSTTPMSPLQMTPVPPQPSTWGPSTSPPMSPQKTPIPPQPATWGAASPVPPQPASWGGPGSPIPAQPMSWGGMAMPPCPPPAWPAPRSLETGSPQTMWIDEVQDIPDALLGSCQKPLKVYMEQIECEVLALDPCFPATKQVPQWF